MAGWVKALLFLLGGAGAAAGTAYITGALDPWLAPKPAEVSGLLQAPDAEATPTPPAGQTEAQPKPEPEPAAGETVTTPKADRLVAPVFDVLRVEPDGSVLVAGKAGANAQVEVLSGEAVLGRAAAGPEGDFVVVLDEMLKPGDYRLTLRAIAADGEAVLSDGTAIVSIPEAKDGQVLAMVEEPGQPAQLISVPQVEEAAPAGEPAEETVAEAQPEPAQEEAQAEAEEQPAVAEAQPDEAPAEEAAAPAAEAEAEAEVAEEATIEEPAAPQPAAVYTVSVEAVEIEGDTVFVAGRADPGRTVRVYAGTVLLGDARASEGGRFLVEAKRHLEVGDYVIRADLLGDDGSVVARAGVPFEREPGEAIAAVAPATPAAPAAPAAPAVEEPAQAAPDAVVAEDEAKAEEETDVAAAPAAPAEDEVTAPPLQRVDGAVIIRRGDSLWRISRRVYGHGIRYSTIYLANQDQIHDPNRIWPGQVFSVPGETPEGEQADLDAIGEQAVRPEDRETVAK